MSVYLVQVVPLGKILIHNRTFGQYQYELRRIISALWGVEAAEVHQQGALEAGHEPCHSVVSLRAILRHRKVPACKASVRPVKED